MSHPAADRDGAAAIDSSELGKLVAQLTLDEKLQLITGEDVWSIPAMPRIGLRKIRLSDGPVGVRGVTVDERDSSVLVPNPSALAAAWDPEVSRQAGALLGAQARAKDIQVLLAPTVNMHRTPLGGRHFECYSEDPLLAGRTAVGYIEGVQSMGVAATAKHFVANDCENDRMTYDVQVDERTLRELYLAPFEAAVHDARVWLVMSAYNGVNGATMTENFRLQNGILKDEWGFDGVVVSDWMAVRSTEPAAVGGTDLAMPGPLPQWAEPLRDAVREGRVDEAVLDDKVTRILRLAARVGALGDTEAPEAALPDDAPARIRTLAARSMVLLQNRGGTLPLDPSAPRRVAVIGPNSRRLSAQGGGSARCFPEHVVEIADGVRAALGPDTETTVRDGAFTHRRLPGLTRHNSTDPITGEPGVGLEFRGLDGTLLGTENRLGSYIVLWPGLFPEGTASITVRTRVAPETDGVHLLDVLGVGTFTLGIDGAEQTVELVTETGDIVEGLMRPALRRVEVPAQADVPVELSLTYAPDTEVLVAGLGFGWGTPRAADDDEMLAAIADAAAADVAIVVVGTTDDIESEGFDRDTLALPGRSDELVAAVAAVNPNTIVVVNAGSPVLMPWRDDVAAVLWAWLPGQEGGAAVADVLFGHAEPGGRLPTTFPAAEADTPILSTAAVDGRHDYAEGPHIGYRLWALRGARPAYPFGHGLGYTDWEYGDVRVDGDAEQGLVVEAALTNTGARSGLEVVQVYLEPADGTLFGEPEPLRLVGYAVAKAAAGETATVRITVDRKTLRRWDTEVGGWSVEPGTYRVAVGRSAGDVRQRVDITL
ncbi:beta-glucosidase family protein [Uniformispora flossi]|uniref:beta-glucosidase n=1 Tax=Uniformispora flossi TaxID=3390723 RepID=UPI003C2D0844